jgi:hypothetical protein
MMKELCHQYTYSKFCYYPFCVNASRL